jgi:hypothetical protein
VLQGYSHHPLSQTGTLLNQPPASDFNPEICVVWQEENRTIRDWHLPAWLIPDKGKRLII